MGTVGRASLRWRNIRRFEIGRLASPFNLLSEVATKSPLHPNWEPRHPCSRSPRSDFEPARTRAWRLSAKWQQPPSCAAISMNQ